MPATDPGGCARSDASATSRPASPDAPNAPPPSAAAGTAESRTMLTSVAGQIERVRAVAMSSPVPLRETPCETEQATEGSLGRRPNASEHLLTRNGDVAGCRGTVEAWRP